MKGCREFTEMLPAYAEGSLDTDDKLSLERHLAECASCAAEVETLQRLEAACTTMRATVAGASDITKLMEVAMTTTISAAPRVHGASILKSVFSRRWLSPVVVAAAAAIILAVFFFPGLRGASALTWADVVKSVEAAPWAHYVTTDASTNEVVYEEWGTPGSREVYVKVDKGKFRPLPNNRFTDFMRSKQWSQDTAVLDPNLQRSVSPGRIEGASTVFDITYSGRSMWRQARKERVYVDNATKLPTRIESECYFNLNGENETTHYVTAIDYPSTGPSELVAIGVPHAAPELQRTVQGVQPPAAQPVQPPSDEKAVIDEYNRRRDAFAAACAEYRALYYADAGSSVLTYLLDDKDAAYRLEMYWPGAPMDLILAGGLPPVGTVEICNGTLRRDWQIDGQTKTVTSDVPVRLAGGKETTRKEPRVLRMSTGLSQCEPASFSWPPLGQGAKLIKSDDPALAGLIGFEAMSPLGEIARHRYWINPERDYVLERWEWDEFKGGKWQPFRREIVTAYAQLSTGQYYASAKRIFGAQFASSVTYTITEHPTFDKDTFNPDVSPWATAELTLTGPQGVSADTVKLLSLTPALPGWQPKTKADGSTIIVTNLLRTGPTAMLLFDDKRGLVKALTVTPVDGQAKLDVALEQGIEFSGFVKDETGAPVADADVLLDMLADAEGIPSDMGGIEVAQTDRDGRYTFHLVAPGVAFGVEAHHDGFQRGQVAAEIDPVARTAKAPDIIMTKASSIGGRVTDASTGLPIEGLTVRINVNHPASYAKSHMWDVYWNNNNDWTETTDKDGRWSFGCNSRYVYKVRILDGRYNPMALDAVPAGSTNVDFNLTPAPNVPDSPKQ